MTVSNKQLRDKDKESEELISVIKKFHKDFAESSHKSLRIDKARNEREIDDKKRQTLGDISNTSISNVTNISNLASDRSGGNISSIVIPTKKTDIQVVDELKGINKTIVKTSSSETKKDKSILKNSILQARVLEAGFSYVKDFFFGGASDTDRIVNAVNNVEQAIIKGDKIILDERSNFQKVAESLPDNNLIKSISKSIPTSGGIGSKILGGISATSDKVASDKSSPDGFNIKETVGGVVSSFINMFEMADKDPKVKKQSKDATSNISSMFVDMLDKGMTGVLGANFLSKKSGFLGAIALFGSSSDLALSTAILNPLKSLKLGYKALKTSMAIMVDRPYLQGVALASSAFGTFGGVFAATILPLAKVIRPLTKDLPTLSDAFLKTREIIKDSLTSTKDFLVEHTGGMLKRMKKSLGKKFIIMGVIMGGLGAKMLGIMGTIMVAASAVWAGIVATAIAALPFIIGGLILAAVVGIGYLIYKKWGTIKAKWNEYVAEPFMGMVDTVVEKFKSIKATISNAVSGFFDAIVSTARTAVEMLPFGKSIATEIFGEKKQETIKSSDTSQVAKIVDVMKTPQLTKEDNVETQKTMKSLDKTLKEMSRNMNRRPPPQPTVPQSNLDDLSTVIVTMGG